MFRHLFFPQVLLCCIIQVFLLRLTCNIRTPRRRCSVVVCGQLGSMCVCRIKHIYATAGRGSCQAIKAIHELVASAEPMPVRTAITSFIQKLM